MNVRLPVRCTRRLKIRYPQIVRRPLLCHHRLRRSLHRGPTFVGNGLHPPTRAVPRLQRKKACLRCRRYQTTNELKSLLGDPLFNLRVHLSMDQLSRLSAYLCHSPSAIHLAACYTINTLANNPLSGIISSSLFFTLQSVVVMLHTS